MSSEEFEITTSSWYYLDVDQDLHETSINWDMHIFTVIEIVRLLIRLSALISDIYLIVIIVRFMKLRTMINLLLFLYAIINIAFLTLGVMVTIIVRFTAADYNTDCLLIGIENFTEILLHFVLTLLAISWYVPNYHPALYGQFPIAFKYGLGICFLIISTTITGPPILNCSSQSAKYYHIYFIVELVCFMFCCAIIITLTVLKQSRNPLSTAQKTAYAFSIPQVVFMVSVISSLLSLLVIVIEFHVKTYDKMMFRLVYLEQISSCLDLAQPIVVLSILAKSSKHFKMAHLKCCKKNLQNYGNDDIDSNSAIETPANNVTFHTSSEHIRL